jgi:DNA-binding response OmpR family regulator
MDIELGNEMRRREARTILAIDANRGSLHPLAHWLGKLGHFTVMADRGDEARGLIAARGFDLLLLDLSLPDFAALRVLRALRAARDTADLPVIALTDAGDSASAIDAFAAGADDCVTRPYDVGVLAARIERALARAGHIDALKRCNRALDARVAARAIELGEARSDLAVAHTDRDRLAASLGALQIEAAWLRPRN